MEYIVVLLSAVNLLLLVCLLFSNRKKTGFNKEDVEQLQAQQRPAIDAAMQEQYDRFQKFILPQFQHIQELYSDQLLLLNDKLLALKDNNAENIRYFFEEQGKHARMLDASMLQIRNQVEDELNKLRSENQRSREASERNMKELSNQVRQDLDHIRSDNEKRIEQMRMTVDERLEKSLDQRLSRSFEQVSRNLDNLYQAIGEINKLSKDVGDLNKLFGNVKSRGVWGEVQVDSILSDILTPDQYERNFKPRKNSQESVEFAIKLPGKDKGNVFIPVDSKFPKEDYERYVDSLTTGDAAIREIAFKAMRDRVRREAMDISRKYINPPVTTDFAILFVPTESLYAELLRIPGYTDDIQKNYKVIISGPTTFAALVTSLQMGFRTLQIEKKTKDVWKLFAQIKKQMELFTKSLDETQLAIDKASIKISDVIKRHHRLNTKLESVEISADDGETFLIEDDSSTEEVQIQI